MHEDNNLYLGNLLSSFPIVLLSFPDFPDFGKPRRYKSILLQCYNVTFLNVHVFRGLRFFRCYIPEKICTERACSEWLTFAFFSCVVLKMDLKELINAVYYCFFTINSDVNEDVRDVILEVVYMKDCAYLTKSIHSVCTFGGSV